MKTLTLILLFLFTATLSYAQVYKWVDEKGIVHFTDDITRIPERHRRTLEEVEVKEEKIETKEEGEAPQKKQADSYKDRLGRGEENWKGRKKKNKKKKKKKNTRPPTKKKKKKEKKNP